MLAASSSSPRAPWSEDSCRRPGVFRRFSHIVHVTAVGGVNTRPTKAHHMSAATSGVRNITVASCAGVLLAATGSPPGPLRRGRRHAWWPNTSSGCAHCAAWLRRTRPVVRRGKDPSMAVDEHTRATVAAVACPCCRPHAARRSRRRSATTCFPWNPRPYFVALRHARRRLAASPGPKLDGTGGGGAAAAGTELLFRGFGPTDPKGTVSAALREAL